ncbi:MAG TPA: AmmeMemoRadiSam system protein B [Methanomassiliicoccales archaeon]|nr:AmmeMemoRadiSam system protein B [Methanomassiliicoccales archaeon]
MVRNAAVAGQFYAARAPTLRSEVERCFLSPLGPGYLPKVTVPGKRTILGAMVPHAGLVYSGPVAAHVYNAMAEDGLPGTVIIIGPNHHGVGKGVAVSDEDFSTPFGQVSVDKEIVSRLKGVVELDRSAHIYEHSIEVQLPFLQYIGPDIRIVPIAMGFQDYETAKELASSLRDAIRGKDVVVLASSDMSHYVTPKVAKELDSMVLDKILAMDAKGVYDTVIRHDVSMCGFGPVMSMMMTIDGGTAKLMKYANSGDVHYMQQVVGYAGVILTK